MESGATKLVGEPDSRRDAAGKRQGFTGDASGLQPAGGIRQPHAVIEQRGLFVRVAESGSDAETRHGGVPDYDLERAGVIRIAVRGTQTNIGAESGAIARRCDLPDHGGPLRERGSRERRTHGIPWIARSREGSRLSWRRLARDSAAPGLFEGSRSDNALAYTGGEEWRCGGLSRLRRGRPLRDRPAPRNACGLPGTGRRRAQTTDEDAVRRGAESRGPSASLGERPASAGLVS